MDFFERLQGLVGDALLPEEARAALERAGAALSRGDAATAETEASAALARAPEAARGHALLGLARKAKGDLERARLSLREAVRRGDEDAGTRLALAALELDLGDPARALLEARKARELGAPVADALTLVAKAHARRGEHADASAALASLPEAQRPFEATLLLGELQLHAADAKAARRTFEGLVARAPNDPAALFGLARAKNADGLGREALLDALRALSEAPRRADLVSFVGDLHAAAGNAEGAMAAYERALEIDRRSADAHAGLGELALARGDEGAARAHLREASRLCADDPRVHRALGRLQLAAERGRAEAEREALAKGDEDRALRPDDLYAAIVRGERACEGSARLRDVAESLGRLRVNYDRPLRLAIAGEFNAGKSTLLNALVGDAVAPMGVTPTTAAVNLFVYGPARGARAILRDGSVEDVPLERVAALVDARHGAGDGSVQHVEIVWPAEPLRDVSLVDTPGFNAADEQHELVARRFLAEADAVLWIFDASHAGSASEHAAILDLGPLRGKLVGVLNKADRLADAERALVLDHLRRAFAGEVADWLFVSARDALEARQHLDDAALSASGFPMLWALLEERFFSRARAAKRQATRARLRPLLEGALAVAREDAREASARRAEAEQRLAAAQGLGRALAAEAGSRLEGEVRAALTRAIGETAPEVIELARRGGGGLTSLVSPRLQTGELEFLARALGDRLTASLRRIARGASERATDEARRELRAWSAAGASTAGVGLLREMAERSFASAPELVDGGPFEATAAYLRGWLEGGALASAGSSLARAKNIEDARHALTDALPTSFPLAESWRAFAARFTAPLVELAEAALRDAERDAATDEASLVTSFEAFLAGLDER